MRTLILLLTILLTVRLNAQEQADTIKPVEVIIPTALVAVGVSGMIQGTPLYKFSHNIHNEVVKHDFSTSIDNYLQYAPLAMHLGSEYLGIRPRHNILDRALLAATAYACMTAVTNGVKYTVAEKRPDSSTRNSFPSGHTATSFTGAELVRLEYGNAYGAAAYAVATTVGVMRILNDRHWTHDVLAGAGIGILSAQASNMLLPVWHKLFTRRPHEASTRNEQTSTLTTHMSIMPWATSADSSYGATACIIF